MVERLTENVIATRELDLSGSKKVEVIIGAPLTVDDKRQEFWCRYQILGMGQESIKRGIGGDALQALCIALNAVSTDLYLSEEYQMGRLSWEGGLTIADLGLPVADGILDDVRKAKSRVEALAVESVKAR